jgi:hypothetical protein
VAIFALDVNRLRTLTAFWSAPPRVDEVRLHRTKYHGLVGLAHANCVTKPERYSRFGSDAFALNSRASAEIAAAPMRGNEAKDRYGAEQQNEDDDRGPVHGQSPFAGALCARRDA